MKIRFLHYFISFMVVLIGLGGLFTYDFVIRPTILSKQVVMISETNEILPKGHILKEENLVVRPIDTLAVPKGYFTSVNQLVGKTLANDVTGGVILVSSFVNDGLLSLKEGEAICPIPKNSIFAVNGSLRSGDIVDIYVVPSNENQTEEDVISYDQTGQPVIIGKTKSKTKKILESVPVVYARSDDNNDVLDSENGNVNRRTTSTGNISNLEVKVTDDDMKLISKYIDEGYKVWITRVNQ